MPSRSVDPLSASSGFLCIDTSEICVYHLNPRRMWRTYLGLSDVDGYEGEDGDDADADEEEETSKANDGSTQNVED
jgi:hypothetical protein